MADRLFPQPPDLSQLKQIGGQILTAMERINRALEGVDEKVYLAGFWQGAVSASIILLACFFLRRK